MIQSKISGAFGTNTYIIYNDKKECIVVDPTLDFQNTYNYVIANYDPKAIFLTHGHIDHIDGIKYFENIPIYISKYEKELLFDNEMSLYSMFSMNNPFFNKDLNLRLVDDGDIINVIGYKFEVISTPGHTEGSVCYKYCDGIICGDTLFRCSIGRTDFPTGSYEQLLNSLKKLIATLDDNTICYPGHGNITSIEYEKNNNPFLK
ncbi:MAG: MBL fold metallo-hydrolase [Anaeroplasma sp.]